MKKRLTFTILAFTIAALFISTSSTAQISPGYKAHAAGWLVDINKAYEVSKKTNKPIMANFTGSDWCGWCIKLKGEVFDKEDFKVWAAENVILLEIDFPRRTKLPANYVEQNKGLQSAFGVRGYPTIWIFNLDKDATTGQFKIDAVGKTGYVRGGPNAFINTVNNLKQQYTQKKPQ